jgi:hypothetical protein
MINVGYDNRNAFSGLKMLSLVLFLYFMRLFLSLCTGFFVVCISWKYKYINKAHYYLAKGIYFNQILRISMEAYFEFYLIGFMNFKNILITYNGEKLGVL